jgi:hypothetical protein
MPAFLRMRKLPCLLKAAAGRLLRILQLWHRQLPAYTIVQALLLTGAGVNL